MKEEIVFGFVIVVIFSFALILNPEVVHSASANDTVTISINVSQITMVDINPSNLTWNSRGSFVLEPGSVADNETEASNYSNIWVENIGSVNITKIWFDNSYASSIPFGTGNPAEYDPANMIVIDNSTDGDGNYSFVNRVEFPENDSMYIKTNNVISAASTLAGDLFGRFRNASNEYFFEFDDSSGASANCSSGTFYWSDTAKTKTSTGDTDLTAGSSLALSTIEVTSGRYTGNWSYGEVQMGGASEPYYCVAIPEDCSKIMFSNRNADAPGATAANCGNVTDYLSEEDLTPGAMKKAWVKAYVPLGVAAGILGGNTNRTLTVFVDTT
ncbi:MAG: hypothetical protein KAT91_02865 [Candidatus Aenigmarchaeota archaeon]|nr:hypothetical protein [Candidatus Aenigmarchaeota archaeon]